MERQVSPYYIPEELRNFIRLLNNPSTTKENIQEAQQTLPYSYSQIARIFKKVFNRTITQYVNQVKMNYAKELLSGTELPISQIAKELCFESESHFFILFKKTFNQTPLAYRKSN